MRRAGIVVRRQKGTASVPLDRRPCVSPKYNFIALDEKLKGVIYQITLPLNVLNRSEEERPLPSWWRLRNKYDETRVERLRAI